MVKRGGVRERKRAEGAAAAAAAAAAAVSGVKRGRDASDSSSSSSSSSDSDSSDSSSSASSSDEEEEEAPAPAKKARKTGSTKGLTVHVNGLPFETTEKELREFFASCGAVESVRMPLHHRTGNGRGFAFVEFSSAEEALAAVAKNGERLGGRWLDVRMANDSGAEDRSFREAPLRSRPDGSTVVFVGNLAWRAREEDVAAAFDHCGEIRSVRIATDRARENRPKGYAHVEFASPDAVDEAIKVTGTSVCGRPVRVDFAGKRREQ